MAYNLGPVREWVASAANEIGAKFGIKEIGGWRAQGSVPNSDHPKGRALDVMTSSRKTGDAIAAYAIANAKRLGITYVIWYRQIWQGGKWKPYDGPSPHTDHVHLSFGDKPGTGGNPVHGPISPGLPNLVPDSITGAIAGVGEQIAGIGRSVGAIGTVAESLTRLFLPTNLVRAGAGFAGVIFILIGVWFLSREVRN